MIEETDRREALNRIQAEVVACHRCPRLVEWRERIAREKRAAFADEDYWGRPVPAFGDPDARLFIVGLAPAAHGANRTGRMFTGDRSGDWLFRHLHRAGFANQPDATHREDRLELDDAFITASVRCAPPDNKPTPAERRNCRSYLEREIERMPQARVMVALGGYAWSHLLRILDGLDWPVPSPRPKFAHGAEVEIPRAMEMSGPSEGHRVFEAADPHEGRPVTLLASYHPSQQNTFTGTLDDEMFARIWDRAREILEG